MLFIFTKVMNRVVKGDKTANMHCEFLKSDCDSANLNFKSLNANGTKKTSNDVIKVEILCESL